MKKYTVYTIHPCPYCIRAKNLLNSYGISFHEILLDRNNHEAIEALLNKSGMKTFPQIFFGEKLIGGYTELEKLDQDVGLRNFSG